METTIKHSDTELKITKQTEEVMIISKDAQLMAVKAAKASLLYAQNLLAKEEAILADMEAKGLKSREELQAELAANPIAEE